MAIKCANEHVSRQDYREHIKVVYINTKYLSAITNEQKP